MRIPPYYQYRNWQRFLSGVAIGGFIGWFLFIYIFGEIQEAQVKKIIEQSSEISHLKKEVEIWQNDYNELNKTELTIQKIEINFVNDKEIKKELKLDSLVLLSLNDAAKNELNNLLKKDVQSAAKIKDLIIKTIENKVFKIDDNSYQLQVKQLVLFTTLELDVKIVYVD